ncbi:hypothetical protein OUO20_10095 [Arthrobacter sp. FX8]|nr:MULTISPECIES: hypothetical protein [unclassified Arthrobacter]WAJ35302.1 hypothetical protein OUO20_10095 [Arthrobacter sp. FX8]
MGHRLRAAPRAGPPSGGLTQRCLLAAAGGLPRNPAGQGLPRGCFLRHVAGNGQRCRPA